MFSEGCDREAPLEGRPLIDYLHRDIHIKNSNSSVYTGSGVNRPKKFSIDILVLAR